MCLFYCYGFSLFHHKRYFTKKGKSHLPNFLTIRNSFTDWNIQKFIPNLILKIRTYKQQRNIKFLTFTRKILIELPHCFLKNIRCSFLKIRTKYNEKGLSYETIIYNSITKTVVYLIKVYFPIKCFVSFTSFLYLCNVP